MSDDHLTSSTTLQQRGIDNTAQAAGWQLYSLYGRTGYRYPVHFDGGTAQRWKALDGKKPKYAWLPSKPQNCKYYLPQGVDSLRAAVEAADGTLYIANGEPALLAYLAAGVQNVVCWFGEGQPPHSLAADLRQWGVQTVRYPADKDAAGVKSALKVRDILKASSIAFYPLQWGADVPHKGDANDAWIAAGFDAGRFVAALHDLGALILPAEAPESVKSCTRDRATFGNLKRDEAIAEVIRTAEARPGAPGRTKTNGDWLNFCCLLHEEHEPSAGINTKTGAYTCFVCGSVSLYEVCERLGIDYTPYQPLPTKSAARHAPAAKPAPPATMHLKAQPVQVNRAAERPFDLSTLWQVAVVAICNRDVALLALHVQRAGIAGDFTTADLAAAAGVTYDKAKRWLDKALSYRMVAERFAKNTELESATSNNSVKNAKRRGAAVARHYCLTPGDAWAVIVKRLPDHVQELMGAGDPDVVLRGDAVAAGLAEGNAEQLEAVTDEASRSLDAFEVRAKAERAAVRKTKQLLHLAETNSTPFKPDALPLSPAELSAALVAALIATAPERTWRQRELMWAAGVKRGSVASVIKKTNLMPAAQATLIDVPVEGKDLHRAVRARCKEHQGAPVAWVCADGNVTSYSRDVPQGVKAVRLNIGKKYVERSAVTAEEKATLPPSLQEEKTPAPEPTEADMAERARKQARTRQMPALRGCMEARGWKYIPGPYSYWERDASAQPNTWEGMVDALLLDVEWAREQQFIRHMQEVEF